MVGGLDRIRGSYMALVTEVQLCILRGELAVPQKNERKASPQCGAFLLYVFCIRCIVSMEFY